MSTPNKTKLALLALTATMLPMQSCQDGFDYDKISSEINITPGILFPIAYSDVNVEYLFDERDNVVQYYTAEDGTHRLKIKTIHDSINKLSAFDIFSAQFDNARTIDATIDLRDQKSGTTPISKSVNSSITLSSDESFSLQSITSFYSVAVDYEGFEAPATLCIDIAGNKQYVSILGSNRENVMSEEAQTITVKDDKIDIKFTLECEAQTEEKELGTVTMSTSLIDVQSITGSTSGIVLESNQHINLTHLENFKKIGQNVEYADPRLWLTCTNATDLACAMTPAVESLGDKTVTLNNKTYNIAPRQVGYEAEMNKNNSNVLDFMCNTPDTVTYTSTMALGMANGAQNITLHRGDTLFLGYKYEVPFEIRINGEVSADTIKISDMPGLEEVEEARLVVSSTNSLPMGTRFDLEFINTTTGEKMSSISLNGDIPMPDLTSGGYSKGQTKLHSVTVLTQQNIEDLANADAVIMRVVMETGENFVVPLLENELKLDISLAAKFQYKN